MRWIISLFRKWFRPSTTEETPEPVMVAQIITRRSARLVYQRRNGIEPLMTPVRSRKSRITR